MNYRNKFKSATAISGEKGFLLKLSHADNCIVLATLGCLALLILASPWVEGRAVGYVKASSLLYISSFAVIFLSVPDSEKGLLHPLVFTVLWWGLVRDFLPKITVFWGGLDKHAALGGLDNVQLDLIVATSTLYSSLSIILISIAFFIFRFKFPIFLRTPEPPRVFPGLIFLAMVSLLSFFMLLRDAGGMGMLLMQRGMSVEDRVVSNLGGHWLVLSTLLEVACYIALSVRKGAERSLFFWFFVCLSMIIGFVSTGSRSGVIMQLVLIAIIYSLKVRAIPYRAIFVGSIVSILLVGGLGQLRHQMQRSSHIEEVAIEGNLWTAFTSGVNTISQYAGEVYGLYGVVGKVPHEVPFLWGESYKSILYAPFPRVLVGEKPLSGGRLASDQIYGNPQSGVPPTYIGEAYWNYGIIGVILVSLLWGAILRLIYEVYRQRVDSPLSAIPFILILFYARPDSNSLVGALQAIVIFYFSYVVIFLMGRVRL